MRRMTTLVTSWHHDFNRLAEEFFLLVAKFLFYLRIHHNDSSCLVNNNHGIRRRLQESAKHFLRSLTFKEFDLKLSIDFTDLAFPFQNLPPQASTHPFLLSFILS